MKLIASTTPAETVKAISTASRVVSRSIIDVRQTRGHGIDAIAVGVQGRAQAVVSTSSPHWPTAPESLHLWTDRHLAAHAAAGALRLRGLPAPGGSSYRTARHTNRAGGGSC